MAPILVLDVDGVIIDGFPRNRWDTTLHADLGIDPREMDKRLFGQDWTDVLTGKITKETLVASFLASQPVAVSVDEFIDYWHGRDANVQHEVIEVALEWKSRTGGVIALGTNQDPSRARYLREDLEFDKHFDVAIISSEIGAKKPDIGFFEKADQMLNRAPGQDVFFLDDMLPNVEVASRHGWQGIHVPHPEHASQLIRELLPDWN